jgi:hypothetical protein
VNERFKEFELEAIAYADSKVPANDRYNDIYHSIVRGKFAELIVRECVTICNDTNDASYLNGVIAGRKIKQHFGVEE